MHGGAIPPHATGVNDIICGNGKRYRKTQGNEMYHCLVRDFLDEYAKQVHRKSKTTVTKSIIEAICMVQPPGRFLLMTILLPTTGAETNQQGAETLLLLIY